MSTVVPFDTLAYANKLKSVNIPAEQAEMQAEAMRDILEAAFHTAELATKTDVNLAIALVRKDMEAMEQRLNARMDAVEQRSDAKMGALEQRSDAKMDALEQRMDARMDALEQRMDAMMNKIIIRLSGVLIVVLGAMQGLAALLPRLMA